MKSRVKPVMLTKHAMEAGEEDGKIQEIEEINDEESEEDETEEQGGRRGRSASRGEGICL